MEPLEIQSPEAVTQWHKLAEEDAQAARDEGQHAQKREKEIRVLDTEVGELNSRIGQLTNTRDEKLTAREQAAGAAAQHRKNEERAQRRAATHASAVRHACNKLGIAHPSEHVEVLPTERAAAAAVAGARTAQQVRDGVDLGRPDSFASFNATHDQERPGDGNAFWPPEQQATRS